MFITQQEVDLLSEENKLIKMHAQSKNSPNGPLNSVEELYSLRNKCTLTQAALHTAMNPEIRFRFRVSNPLTVITIKGLCAFFQQKKNDGGKQSEKPNMPHIVTVRVFCYCWNRWFRGFNCESTRERTNRSSFSTSIIAKKQLSSGRMCRCLRLTSENQQSLYEQQ